MSLFNLTNDDDLSIISYKYKNTPLPKDDVDGIVNFLDDLSQRLRAGEVEDISITVIENDNKETMLTTVSKTGSFATINDFHATSATKGFAQTTYQRLLAASWLSIDNDDEGQITSIETRDEFVIDFKGDNQ